MKGKDYQIVEIHWIDSAGINGWIYHDDVDCTDCVMEPVRTVGLLLNETDDTVSIASSVGKNQTYSPVTIPRCSIVGMWNLRCRKSVRSLKGNRGKAREPIETQPHLDAPKEIVAQTG